ncbi:MAG: hypothetical protein D3923_14535 [Candidatus Electrothrix sp. AR3]|nr:hypothetical protein [Candidatus Electrothrix sp. AR3]
MDGQKKKITLDLKKLIENGDRTANIEIFGGDTVSIALAKDATSICYITGQVNRPGAYPCDANTTVLKIVSLAGSFTGIASESSVRINRVVNGKKQVLKDVELDTSVLADDVIEVPESFF